MKTIYDKYMTLPINKGLLCLEDTEILQPRIFAIPSMQSR